MNSTSGGPIIAASGSSAQGVSTGAPSQANGSTSGSARARQQNRKKGGGGAGSGQGTGTTTQSTAAGDAESVYRVETVSVAGSKRAAHDRVDGEPRKRKRVDHSAAFQAQQQALLASAAASANAGAKQGGIAVVGSKSDGDSQPSLFDFSTLPTASLYRYIIHHDLIPHIYPTPLSADDPPPPAALLDPLKMASRAPSPQPLMALGTTPANRPQRRSRTSKEVSQRRSTRILEEETRVGPEQVPVLADVGEIHNVLANIAQRHFRESTVKEVDTLASFLWTVKAKGGAGRHGWR